MAPDLTVYAGHVSMHRSDNRLWSRLGWAATVLLLAGLTGCPTAGVYRTARTLNQGEFDIGILASGTHFESPGGTFPDSAGMPVTGPSTSGTFPNPLPELTLHYGIRDNVEIGGRLALSALLTEFDIKVRLVGDRNSKTHLAIAPALGYEVPYGGLVPAFLWTMEGPRATLPIILLTQDLSRGFGLSLAAYGSYRQVVALQSQAVSILVAGGTLAVEFHGPRGYFMPLIDFSRTLTKLRNYPSVESQTYVIFGVAFRMIPSR